jgi:prephenate dehydratase
MSAGDSPELEAALKEVGTHTSMLRILGTYRSADEPV